MAECYVSPHQATAEAFSAGYGVDPVIMLRNRSFIRDGQGQADGALKGKHTLRQPVTPATSDNARGQVDFQTTPEGEVQALVMLFDNADLSTVPHESMHIFTRQLKDIAGQGNEEAAADVRALREWAGVAPQGPLAPEEYRSFQEAVATAGEACFMEGKAPTAKLRGVFVGFENHRLTDEVRAVFDRMLSADDIFSRSGEGMDLLDAAARVNATLPLEDQSRLHLK